MRACRDALLIFAALGLAGVLLCGCDVPVDRFPSNQVHALVISASREVPTEIAAQDTTAAVEAWFGTPVQPLWPVSQMSDDSAKQWVNPENLLRAAGPVYSDQNNRHFGLFNEHCVTCHGVSGGGDGPASLLQNPYPRDFRAGIFKWKSTERSAKPTRDDLVAILRHGAPGTAMPSFDQMSDEDVDALVDYVIYLSVRGEFERRLMAAAVDQLGYEDTRPDEDASLLALTASGDQETDATELAIALIDRVVGSWVAAPEQVIEVAQQASIRPTNGDVAAIDLAAVEPAAVERGRALFHGDIAKCFGCHGQDGKADVFVKDFDDWTKEFTTMLSITPTDRDAVRPFRSAGALRPREIFPRQLDTGVYRGGGDPETLYRRVVAGIAGTPMPGMSLVAEPTPTGLTSDQVWDIVHYLRSLSEAN